MRFVRTYFVADRYGQSVMRFANDVRLVWRNAKRYNKEGSGVYAAADALAKAFECLLERWVMGPWRAKRCGLRSLEMGYWLGTNRCKHHTIQRVELTSVRNL